MMLGVVGTSMRVNGVALALAGRSPLSHQTINPRLFPGLSIHASSGVTGLRALPRRPCTTKATTGSTKGPKAARAAKPGPRGSKASSGVSLYKPKWLRVPQLKSSYPRNRKDYPPRTQKSNSATEETVANSDRTHPANSRFNLSKNSLVLRFSNENSYLNWARNGVLSSGVGVAMYAQEHHRGAQLSGAGLLLLGFGYIGVGTAKYIYYILRFRHVMELSWGSVIGTISHASVALMIWLTATASFLESVPLELDAMLLTDPIASYLPFRIRQGLIETYSLYLDDLEHHTDEQERVLRAIRGEGTHYDYDEPTSDGKDQPPVMPASS